MNSNGGGISAVEPVPVRPTPIGPAVGPGPPAAELPPVGDSGNAIPPEAPAKAVDDAADATTALPTSVDVRSVSLAVLAVLAVIFVLDWGEAFFIPVMFGVLLSYAFSPIVNRLETWRVPRICGALLVLIVLVGGPALTAYALIDEATAMIQTLPDAAQKFRRVLRSEGGVAESPIDKMQRAASEIEAAADETAAKAKAGRGVTLVQMEKPKVNVRDMLWSSTAGLLVFAGQATVVLFLAYFLLVTGNTFRRKLVKITGPTLSKKKVTVEVLNEVNEQIQRFLLIQVLAGVLVGVASWLAFSALGLENAAIWGIIAAVCNGIPYLGPVLVSAGIAVVSFVQFGTLSMMVLLSGVALLITSLEGFLLTPWLCGRACRMNPAVVFVAVLFWGWLWGAWGLLLGVPIMMIIKVVCDHVDDLKPIGELMGS